MLASTLGAQRLSRLFIAALLATCCTTVVAANATARSSAPSLKKAAKARKTADHRLVVAAQRLKTCERAARAARTHAHKRGHKRVRINCAPKRRALQAAGHRLARADRALSRLGRKGRRARAAAVIPAPTITVAGQKLSWNKVSNANTYVGVRKVPGMADQYSVLTGTSITPPAVSGKTVRYSVRVAQDGSAWAKEVSIAYPAPGGGGSTPAPPADMADKAAPAVSVSGNEVRWSRVGNVSTYVFVRKVPGEADAYSVVNGTSITPPAAPGKTVRYSVRTAVDGSAWAPEVSISYPDNGPTPTPTPSPTPQPTPSPTPAPGGSGFSFGLVMGSSPMYELDFAKRLSPKTARIEVGVGTPASQLRSTVDAYARAGIRPLLLAGFHGRLPSADEARNVGSWAAEFGPGGSFWQGKSYPAGTAVTMIEFGNETSYKYQFSDTNSTSNWQALSSYQSRAQTYALRFKDAQIAVSQANRNVGLLAIGESGDTGTTWVNNMFRAVPDLGQRVGGWTIHPYGPKWQERMDAVVNNTRAKGAPDSVPLVITEWGLATDNGHCLDDNYGWNKCMSYSEAGSTMHSVIGNMRSRYGSRLRALYMYQTHDQRASGTANGREYYFGALQSSGADKGGLTSEVRSQIAAR